MVTVAARPVEATRTAVGTMTAVVAATTTVTAAMTAAHTTTAVSPTAAGATTTGTCHVLLLAFTVTQNILLAQAPRRSPLRGQAVR